MILTLNPNGLALLRSPAHAPLVEMLRQLVEKSYEDTMANLLFPDERECATPEAVLRAEGRVLMGLRKIFEGAPAPAAGQASPNPPDARNSPAGVV